MSFLSLPRTAFSCCASGLRIRSAVVAAQAAAANSPANAGVFQEQRRSTTFYKQSTASTLWKVMTTVSPQGKMRGRAKGLVRQKNLNRGQKLGFGKAKVSFPGLTVPVLDQHRTRAEIGPIEDKKYQEYVDGIQDIRAKTSSRSGARRRQTPLERGWTSASPQGRKFGAPVSVNPELKFHGFQSILIEYKQVGHMETAGQQRAVSCLMVTGNRHGVAGFTLQKAPTGRGPGIFQTAVNKAGLRLMSIERYEDRTVYHDFFTQFGNTRLMVKQAPAGHGLIAHRVVIAICELVGIKDLYAKLEGSTSANHICKAFFLGLLRQKTHQAMANEKQLHLVEFRAENDNFPRVVASPEDGKVRTKDEILPNEVLDFETVAFDGYKPHYRPKPEPAYVGSKSWNVSLRKRSAQKHHKQRIIEILAEKGTVSSHFYPKYPECRNPHDRETHLEMEWSNSNKKS